MNKILQLLKERGSAILSIVVGIGLLITAGATQRLWLPQLQRLTGNSPSSEEAEVHDHDEGNQGDTLQLSSAARKNIGLWTRVVRTQTFTKTVSVPAMIVERPGRSQVEITAPLTGIVTRVYPIEGEAIQPGQPLFDLRLTHEDLVNSQRDFLQSAENLDVVKKEIMRLESAGEGIIAGRRVIEHKYEQQKIEAALHAQKQGLLLHGLNEQQIDQILASRRLLPMLTVTAPPFDEDAHDHHVEHLYHVQSILVKRGQSLAAGQALAVLADHCLLYVEGQAFEDDAERLIQASREHWLIDVSDVADDRSQEAMKLQVFYVADHVDQVSRALRFYLSIPNEIIRDDKDDEHRFVAWQFRPGQRMEVKIPLGEPWTNQIVLPPEAVVNEGAEAFVFEQTDRDHFDRVEVHVIYQDKDTVVIENDGELIGSTLAMSGAYQMHLAIKNKMGGGVDPHAGHTH
ncbi:MAG: efflux RND transporter periplasmic adaptor subunit [Pirellulaceae bacterium]|nr:secretion protein HlyD [Planctomycetaceae bacterium]